MRKIGIYFFAAVFALTMTFSAPRPAKADSGAIVLAIVAALLTVSTVKCANAGEKGGDRLCIFDIFGTRGNIEVKPTSKKKKGQEARNTTNKLAYASPID